MADETIPEKAPTSIEGEGIRVAEWDTKDGHRIKAISFPDGSAQAQQLTPAETARGGLGAITQDEILDIDYDPAEWSKTPEMNTRVRTSVRIVARNVAGLDWELQPIKNESLLTEEEWEIIEKQKSSVKPLFDRPNPQIPLREALYRCWYDRKAVGTGHLEITRKNNGKIDGIYHIPSKYVYPLKKGGWVQSKDGKKRYFKIFGDSRVINVETGKVHDGSKDGALPIKKRATELLTFVEYSSDVEVIGVPPHASAAMAVSGNWYAARRNKNTQVTDATPRAIIALTGGELTEEAEKDIRNFLNAGGRNEEDMRSNRIMLLTVQKASAASGATPSIVVTPLTIASGEDATFPKYREANDEEIREAYALAALYYGSTEGSNRASAGIARHVTIEQTFDPETRELEYRMNCDLVRDILIHPTVGYEDDEILIRFNLIRPPISDEVDQSQVMSRYVQGGGLAPNDIRRHLRKRGWEGLNLWEGEWAELPLFITLALLKWGMFKELGLPGFEAVEEEERETPEEAQEEMDEGVKYAISSVKKDLARIRARKKERVS